MVTETALVFSFMTAAPGEADRPACGKGDIDKGARRSVDVELDSHGAVVASEHLVVYLGAGDAAGEPV